MLIHPATQPPPPHPPTIHSFPNTVPTAVTSQTREIPSIRQLEYHQSPHKFHLFILSPDRHHPIIQPPSHPFMHSATSPPPYISPQRLVRRVRKQLMELSSAKKHHHLLYPLSDDSLVWLLTHANTHTHTHTNTHTHTLAHSCTHTDTNIPLSDDSWGK